MTEGWNRPDFPGDAMILGIAKCEAEPQCCTAVARRPNGDVILANENGELFPIPAGEVMATAALMLKTSEPRP